MLSRSDPEWVTELDFLIGRLIWIIQLILLYKNLPLVNLTELNAGFFLQGTLDEIASLFFVKGVGQLGNAFPLFPVVTDAVLSQDS